MATAQIRFHSSGAQPRENEQREKKQSTGQSETNCNCRPISIPPTRPSLIWKRIVCTSSLARLEAPI